MKKVFLTLGIILIALAVMAPNPEKAERLKVNDHDWDSEKKVFTIDMSCQFGMATAAEANGKFTVLVDLDIFDYDQNGWDYDVGGEFGIYKVDGAQKDADNFISIEPASVSWNGDDDGSGNFKVDVSLTLVGPSGNALSTTTVRDALVVPPTGGGPCEACGIP